MSYLGQQLGQGQAERFVFTASGGETSVTTSDDGRAIAYTVGQVDVYLNGAKLINGSDFTATTGTSITGLAALTASDVVEVFALSIFQASDTVSAASGGTFNGNVTVDANLSVTGTVDIDTSLNVDGTVTADGLTVEKSGAVGATINRTTSSGATVAVQVVGSTVGTLGSDTGGNGRFDISSVSGGASSNAVQISHTGGTPSALFASNGDISFYEDTGTTPKFFWDASAEALGIGTTSPQKTLDVAGTLAISNSPTSYWDFDRNDSDGSLVISDTGSEKMRIDTSGNLLVRQTSAVVRDTNAGGDVQAFWGNQFSSSSATTSKVMIGTGSSQGYVGMSRVNTDSKYITNAYIRFDNSVYTAGSEAGFMSFYTQSGGTNAAERMRINSSGDLMVGTQTPQGRLTVVGSAASSISLALDSNASYGEIQTYNSSPLYLNRQGNNVIVNASGGNFLVGKTDASASAGAGHILLSNGSYYSTMAETLNNTSTLNVYSTGAGTYRFFVGMGGQVYATSTSITAISDASLKENVRDLDKGLDTILALKPRRFDWKNGDGNDIMGFVAQEVQEALPELVHDYKYNETETKLGLKMGDMLPSLVKAIQEQQEIINDLRARVAQLEGV